MYLKSFIASLIMAAALSLVAFFINLSTLLPPAVGYFIVALIAGCVTSIWVNLATAGKRKKKKGGHKRGKPVNGGKKETGSVKWFSPNKGFGFITRDNGEDIFVHFRSIMGKGHRVLREGQRVEFAITQGTKGLQAEDVTPSDKSRQKS